MKESPENRNGKLFKSARQLGRTSSRVFQLESSEKPPCSVEVKSLLGILEVLNRRGFIRGCLISS